MEEETKTIGINFGKLPDTNIQKIYSITWEGRAYIEGYNKCLAEVEKIIGEIVLDEEGQGKVIDQIKHKLKEMEK